MTKLRECPFCGNEDIDNDEGCFPTYSGSLWVVRCGNPNCNAEVSASYRCEAIAAWNRRASDVYAPTEAGLKALGGES